MQFNERDELCNEREMGLSEADYNELDDVFAEMDARDSDLQDIDEDERYMGDDE